MRTARSPTGPKSSSPISVASALAQPDPSPSPVRAVIEKPTEVLCWCTKSPSLVARADPFTRRNRNPAPCTSASRHCSTTGFTKQELRAALNAADQWVSDNQASYVAALPQPFRGQSTTSQKARLLTFVISKRFLEGVT